MFCHLVRTLFVATLFAAAISFPVAAATGGHAQPKWTASQRKATLSAIKDHIARYYVFPTQRAGLVAALDAADRSGQLTTTNATAFAEAVSATLLSASHDQHLHLSYDPQWYAQARRPQRLAPEPASAQRANGDNYGLTELRVLPGNIRYLKISGFGWIEQATGAAYDDAMRFLRDGAAIVLDLRGNTGGDHSATRYLISHFLDADVLLYTFESQRHPGGESRTYDYLPAGRLKGIPLYVLIDGRTRSAGEDVAYQVQQYHLGELVGVTTAGAANNNDYVPIAPGFRLSLSTGRPVHPVSHTNWEGRGIAPTIAAASSEALDVAQAHALERLAKRRHLDPVTKAELEWARVGIDAKLHPVTLPPGRHSELVGTYGEMVVREIDGELVLERPDRDPSRLHPLTRDGLFELDNVYPLRVRLTGKRLELYWLTAPEPLVYRKSGP